MAVTTADLAGLISRYARTFHDVIGDAHHVASPLGAWLVLALAGPAAEGAQRDELTGVLGTGVDQAAQTAGALLADPHPLVAAAAAVWNRPGLVDEGWLAGLPAVVERGGVPTQAEADDWARRRTDGLIEKFPITIDDAIYVILASALATKVSWVTPFELAPAADLGAASPWAELAGSVLRMPAGRVLGHKAFIAPTERAGDVAVHVASARGGLLVLSVAAGPGVPAGDVLGAAHDLAVATGLGRKVPERSLFDLPLGEGPLWTLRESRSSQGDAERCTAVLPAWSARSTHDLSDARYGFAAAAAALGKGDPWKARQVAMARYGRTGFEAAAVSAMAVGLSAVLPRQGRLRTAELRFGHPYAAVAVAADDRLASRSAPAVPAAWRGLPVFSAWVAEPQDASGQ
jgi:hypothetical protein